MKYACVFLLILEESDHYGSGNWKVSAELGANNKRPGGGKQVVIRSQPDLYTRVQTGRSDGRNAPDSQILRFFDERQRHDAGP